MRNNLLSVYISILYYFKIIKTYFYQIKNIQINENNYIYFFAQL